MPSRWHARISGSLAGLLVLGAWLALFHLPVWLGLSGGLLTWLYLWHKARYLDDGATGITGALTPGGIDMCSCGAVILRTMRSGQMATQRAESQRLSLTADAIPDDTARDAADWEQHVSAVLQDIARHQNTLAQGNDAYAETQRCIEGRDADD